LFDAASFEQPRENAATVMSSRPVALADAEHYLQ
jgi:hypothetical protein